MRKLFRVLFFFTFFFCERNICSQNTDSLFAEREKIILQGVDYRNGLFHWNIAGLLGRKLDVGYEKKINLNLSWMGEINWNFKPDTSGITGSAGLRYYYNLEKRIINRWKKKQAKTSCFSADYFEADLNVGWNYSKSFPYKDNLNRELPAGILVGPTLKIGKQRLLWNHIFIDGWIGYKVIINNRGWLVAGLGIGIGI